MHRIAQRVTINGQVIEGPLKNIDTVADLINQLTKFVYPLAGLLLFIYLIWGGYDYLLSGGNPEKIKAGQGKLTAAVVGFALLFIAYLLVKIIAQVFNLGGEVI